MSTSELLNILKINGIKILNVSKRMALWLVWEFSGLRFLYQKLRPLSNAEENCSDYVKPFTF